MLCYSKFIIIQIIIICLPTLQYSLYYSMKIDGEY
jgi:hypothetical protein